MSKHTSGKWIDRGTGRVGTDKQLVAVVYPMEDTAPDEHEANIRLIAAAPDLLEALDLLLHFADHHDCIARQLSIEKARAAIAKATGEQS